MAAIARQYQVQYELARAVNLVSPGHAYQYSVEELLGSGLARFQRFHAQGYRYREALRAFLRERDAADPGSPHVPFPSEYMSQAALASSGIPRFTQPELPLGDQLQAATTPAVIPLVGPGRGLPVRRGRLPAGRRGRVRAKAGANPRLGAPSETYP
ncbi:MAG: DUF3526 domain-containing protein [Candidatus Latescibacterota bacterium]